MTGSRGPLSGETPTASEGGPSEATATAARRVPLGIKIKIKKRPAAEEEPQVSTQTTTSGAALEGIAGGKVRRDKAHDTLIDFDGYGVLVWDQTPLSMC